MTNDTHILPSTSDAERLVIEYARASTDAQDLTWQLDLLPRLADRLPDGLSELPRWPIKDEGSSAFKNKIEERAKGRELLELIRTGRVEALVTDSQDRICRGDQEEWWTFFGECRRAGVRLFTSDGEITLESMSQMMASFRAIIAHEESQNKSHRIRTSFQSSRERGYWTNGKLPFGFTATGDKRERVLTPDPEAMPLVVQAYEQRAGGASKNAVARFLAEATGEEWARHRVRDFLRNPAYAGWIAHEPTRGEVELFEGRHGPEHGVEPPVSRELWEAVQAVDERGPAYFQRRVQPYGNLPRCGECGSRLQFRNDRRAIATMGHTHAYYRCEDKDCRKVSAIAEKLDACIVLGFCSLVRVIHDNVDQADWPILQPNVEQVGQLAVEIADLTRTIQRLHGMAEDVSDEEFAELRPRIATLKDERSEKKRLHDQLCDDADTKRDKLRQLAEALETTLGLGEFPDNVAWAGWTWSQIDVDERRRLLGEIMEGIDVFPDRLALRFSSAGIVLPIPLATGRRGAADKNLRAVGFASFARQKRGEKQVATPS
jgi:DNA invertase Pin-like site-specific DNA recombinase